MIREPPRLLCVDDEPRVLEGLALQLHRGFQVIPALGGEEALATLTAQGPFAVILSDMRMPGMNGAELLARVRELAPETTRVLLTGQTELGAAIAAVNQGGIFRFLTKPCPPAELRLALEAAVEQHRLVTAERVLLEQTLLGSIRALTEILSLTSPLVFGKATRIQKLACELAEAVRLPSRWALEAAAMLSQLGFVIVPEATVEKLDRGEAPSPEERAMVERAPAVTESLLAHIPRLEPVREILARAREPRGVGRSWEATGVGTAAAILKIAIDFDALESHGPPNSAIDTMLARSGHYDAELLQALRALRLVSEEIRELPLRELREGMVLAEDARTTAGLLVVGRGFRITSSFLERARNFASGYVREPLRVVVPSS